MDSIKIGVKPAIVSELCVTVTCLHFPQVLSPESLIYLGVTWQVKPRQFPSQTSTINSRHPERYFTVRDVPNAWVA